MLPTEPAIQEWCERLDKLVKDRRLSEVGYLHDWLNLTFGRGRDERPLPLDLRLHRRLGDAYRQAKHPDRAAQEFAMALEFAPRDIFLLRALGLAYLDADRQDEAKKVVDRIAELDKDAFSHNVECAGLKGRLQRADNNLEGAVETYRSAFERNSDAYYIGDILGQTLLRLGKIEEARGVYRRVSESVDRLAEWNIWTHASRATASLVLNDEPRALHHLAEVAALRPAPDDLKRIGDGLEDVQKWLKLEAVTCERLRAALRGQQ